MNTEKRKLYQVRAHLLKAEVLIKDLIKIEAEKRGTSRQLLEDSLSGAVNARMSIFRFINARFGSIKNLENYK